MTKSPFTGQGSKPQACAASVDYQGRRGACRRDGKYPDVDGIRWWCGIHTPNKGQRGLPRAKDATEIVEVISTSTSVSVRPKAAADDRRIKSVSRAQPAMQDSESRLGNGVDMAAALMSASKAQVADSVALSAMREVCGVLSEIANTNTVGWGDNVPAENYKIIMAHMSDQAREAHDRLSAVIRQLDT